MAKSIKNELARLLPRATVIQDGDQVIRIAGNTEENRTLNYFIFAQVRSILQQNIDRFRDKDIVTPKELKDLVEAVRGLAEASTAVYKEGEQVPDSGRAQERPAATTEVPDFSKLIEVKAEDANQPSKENSPTPGG